MESFFFYYLQPRSLRRDGARRGSRSRSWLAGWLAGLCIPPPLADRVRAVRSKLNPPRLHATKTRDLGVYCFGEWEMVNATPPFSPFKGHLQLKTHPKPPNLAIHILLCCSRKSVKCVMALQYAYKTRIPLHKQH